MKKLLALLLVLMMSFSLAACGGGDGDKPSGNNDDPPASSQQQEQNTPDPGVSAPSDVPMPDGVELPVDKYPFLEGLVLPDDAVVTSVNDEWYKDSKIVELVVKPMTPDKVAAYEKKLAAAGYTQAEVSGLVSPDGKFELGIMDTWVEIEGYINLTIFDTGSNGEASGGGEELPIDLSGFLGTKTGKFYSRFADGRMYMEYEMEMEGQKMSVISATNGDRTYSETKMGGASLGVNIMVGEDMYTIDHTSKLVIKMSLGASAQNIAGAVLEESDVDMGTFTTGTKEIGGKTYDTEELIVEGATAIYCFDGDDLAYIISSFEGQEAVMKIVEATDKVDDSLFEIPADYALMEM